MRCENFDTISLSVHTDCGESLDTIDERKHQTLSWEVRNY